MFVAMPFSVAVDRAIEKCQPDVICFVYHSIDYRKR